LSSDRGGEPTGGEGRKCGEKGRKSVYHASPDLAPANQ